MYSESRTEVDGLRDFFDMAKERVTVDDDFIEAVILEASHVYGIKAMDAAHITAAKAAGCAEFITTELPTKPFFKVRGIRVVHFPV